MRNILLTLLALVISFSSFGQADESKKLVELGKVYKDFMFRNEPTKEAIKEVKLEVPSNLKLVSDFIVESVTTKNKLLTKPFLSLPDDQTLKQIYIVRAINLNLRNESQINNEQLIDSLTRKNIPRYELIDNYYGMLFTSIGNKNQPFDFSKVNFKLKDYNLKDDTEKGIFFLRSMDYCGKTIWGFMNVVKPANTQKAFENIKKFPRFNGQPYYQFNDLYFPDFEMSILKDQDPQSYKSYYIDKYYETLLSHLISLNKEGGSEKNKNDLLLGSILKDKDLYKYTKYQATLESIFKEQKGE
jgi:hypothetical protein